jgi:calcyphosin
MSPARLGMISEAYRKLDKTGDARVTLQDLKLAYNVEHHPKYKSKEMTADQILQEFMDTFQHGGKLDDTVNIYGAILLLLLLLLLFIGIVVSRQTVRPI